MPPDVTLAEFDDPDLAGYVTVAWDSLEHWYEEDEEVFVHARDPFVRVDTLLSSRHVRVEREGHVLAESDAPILLFETGLRTRYYLSESDVDGSLLGDSELETGCPYKGFASYRDVTVGGRRHPNLFWSYEHPFREAADSTPAFGDRRGYQMDPANGAEAVREALLDVEEGADMIMVKPALPYLDVIRKVKDETAMPVAAYNVSGEYAMVKSAAQAGYLDERSAVLEMLTAIRRAGADVVVTYYAKDASRWLRET